MDTIAFLHELPFLAAARLRPLSARLAGRELKAVVAVTATALLAMPLAARWAHDPHAAALPADPPPVVASAPVLARGRAESTAHEGVVEAVRQTIVAAQVPGTVVALSVRAGDTVHAGQVLARIDARAAEQTAAAGAAQARAARAAMDIASRDLERQQQLFAQGFISRAALDRAEAQARAALAEASAQGANAAAAMAQSDLHVVKAPYAGVVADVAVVLGEMALPGRALLTLYDPTALRVSAPIPQTTVAGLDGTHFSPRLEVPGVTAGRIDPARVQILPTVDAASHTLALRLDLPAGTSAVPGMFARVWLPQPGDGASTGPVGAEAHLFVPSRSLVRRTELAAVYVIGKDGRPLLRQVRPGRIADGEVEILSGVAAGERVALDPQAAARVR
jgi:multidrug efflux system membrane fusion protein